MTNFVSEAPLFRICLRPTANLTLLDKAESVQKRPRIAVTWVTLLAASAVVSSAFGGDAALRGRIENSCKRFLDFYAGLQQNGGWGALQHHPTLWDFGGGERHTLRSRSSVDFSKGGFTANKIMDLYLPAYEIFGDTRYLDVARRSGDVLVKGQCSNGVLQAHYFVFPDGRVEPIREADVVEMPSDEEPAPALVMLVWLSRLSGDEAYARAAVRCAELYLIAQNPNGSWAQKYNLRTRTTGGLGYGVLNDGATTDPMHVLLLMYHMTKDRRFLDGIVKAADWLARVQNRRGGIPGWAEQYDESDRPCWARSFEPPAICVTSTSQATAALLFMYRLTHDEKYLSPLRILVEWLREHPRDKWGFYTDPATVEPIHAANYKIIPGGTATALRTAGWVREAAHAAYRPERIERLIEDAVDAAGKSPASPRLEDQKQAWRKAFWDRAAQFDEAISGQNPLGYWVGQAAWKDRAMQCASAVTYAPVPVMLRALHLLAAAEGRVLPYAVGTSYSYSRAWPVPDPFDTPLRPKPR